MDAAAPSIVARAQPPTQDLAACRSPAAVDADLKVTVVVACSRARRVMAEHASRPRAQPPEQNAAPTPTVVAVCSTAERASPARSVVRPLPTSADRFLDQSVKLHDM